ncbi:MAG: hypothetical protein VX733_09050 [Candidatus Latescibacterota bacterium]|nr:hypothetical protein [Candidatus Latescibacterota bacterium]
MNRELFLRLDRVTRMQGLVRRVHEPQRSPDNPVLVGDSPWEKLASLYGTVLYEPHGGPSGRDRFRMWYLTGPYADGWIQVRGRKALGNITLLGYATSEDGVHWIKPTLNQLDVQGSVANNLIDIGRTNCEGIAVLRDPEDPDAYRRYKALYWEHGGVDSFREYKGRTIWGEGEEDGVWLSYSEDGIVWRDCGANPVISRGSDTTQSLVRDPRTGNYVAFGRFGVGGRVVGRSESEDALHFSAPELVLAPDEFDEEGTQFYGMPLDIYEGIYLGMLWVYREGVDGCIETALATSRDGMTWERTLDRQSFLRLGPEGSWEDGMVRVSQCFLTVGDQIYLYYGGVQGAHTGRKFDSVERHHQPAIGLATIRRDGFVSVEAGEVQGELLTHPCDLSGALHVNASTRPGGWVEAEVTDDRGLLLESWRSARFTGNATAVQLEFAGDLDDLADRDLRLRFRLYRANLFSYWWGTDGSA